MAASVGRIPNGRSVVSGGIEEPEDPAIEEVRTGQDSIVLDEDLVAENAAAAPAEVLVRREAMPARLRRMPVAERFKLALRGNLEVRNVLARDPLKLVQSAVLKNPRITMEEVLNLAKSRSLHGDLLRQIGGQKEWVRQYTVRQALVQNPKTPIPVSLGLLRGLRERDVRLLARSKNIPGVIQQAASRQILQRKA